MSRRCDIRIQSLSWLLAGVRMYMQATPLRMVASIGDQTTGVLIALKSDYFNMWATVSVVLSVLTKIIAK